MKELRNPFKIRVAEHIESDATFVRLFSPEVLDLLHHHDVWRKPQIIRSAPGGGKTSLLRLFTPRTLSTVCGLRGAEYSKDLVGRLKGMDAIDENGPRVLGILLSCSRSYSDLDDLPVDTVRKQRLLLSLLNARFVLGALQGALVLKHLIYPNDLRLLKVEAKDTPLSMTLRSNNGEDLYQWAMKVERTICEALDSFAPLEPNLPGSDCLASPRFITEASLTCKGEQVASHLILMLDDVHQLASRQREFLLKEILVSRLPVGVWIAERLEALDTDELLTPGVLCGRDYDSIIYIEDYWRRASGKRFERVVTNIADRRAREAKDMESGPFNACLQESLSGSLFAKAATVVQRRVRDMARGTKRYSAWITERENHQAGPQEMAIAWRDLEILIERDKRKAQQQFDFNLGAEELGCRDGSSVRAAAELFLCREFDIPYYYGVSRLASLASANIDQFLELAGGLFEEVVSALLLKRPGQLTPRDQERILKKSIEDKWRTLPQRMRHGTEVLTLIEAMGKFARWETDKPNAPYAPGVTGIAVTMEERATLKGCNADAQGIEGCLLRLGDVLSACIAHNLLEVALDHRCKGRRWMILYLNRFLCAHFGLPLQYGGWRERTLGQLLEWLERGFTPPRRHEGGLLV